MGISMEYLRHILATKWYLGLPEQKWETNPWFVIRFTMKVANWGGVFLFLEKHNQGKLPASFEASWGNCPILWDIWVKRGSHYPRCDDYIRMFHRYRSRRRQRNMGESNESMVSAPCSEPGCTNWSSNSPWIFIKHTVTFTRQFDFWSTIQTPFLLHGNQKTNPQGSLWVDFVGTFLQVQSLVLLLNIHTLLLKGESTVFDHEIPGVWGLNPLSWWSNFT
jgi:hypothetical protein